MAATGSGRENAGVASSGDRPSLQQVARFADPEFVADPYPIYARLRSEAPVWWCESAAAWIVTSYRDVRAVLCEPEVFSSAPTESKRPPYDNPESGMIIVADPPEHERARRMFTGGGSYASAAADATGDEIRELGERLVQRLPEVEIDAVFDIALPAVIEFTERFFDLPRPEDDEPRWQDALLGYYSPGTGDATSGLLMYLERVVRSCRQTPGGKDPISVAVAANERHRLFSDEQLAWNFFDAILAGAASTVAVTAESIAALARYTDAQDPRFWTTDEAARRSSEELLRWTNHIHLVTRFATREVDLAGESIRAGDAVYAVVASANRDEAVWEHGEELDLHRRPEQANFAFGYGPHIATGAMVARTFLSTLLPIVVGALAPFRPAGAPEHARTRGVSTPLSITITSNSLTRGVRRMEEGN